MHIVTHQLTYGNTITDSNGSVLAPLPVAPVNDTDLGLLLKGVKALKKVAKQVGLDLRGAYRNLDGSFDSAEGSGLRWGEDVGLCRAIHQRVSAHALPSPRGSQSGDGQSRPHRPGPRA